MDSDHIMGIGVSDNKIYIKWHYRDRIVYPIMGDWFFQKAHNEVFAYTCKDKNEAYALFGSITTKDSKEIWNQLRGKEVIMK